jgi:hypothetical protein
MVYDHVLCSIGFRSKEALGISTCETPLNPPLSRLQRLLRDGRALWHHMQEMPMTVSRILYTFNISGSWRFTSIYAIMVYDHVLCMLLWRRVLDKDYQLISTGWYCIYLHLIRLHQGFFTHHNYLYAGGKWQGFLNRYSWLSHRFLINEGLMYPKLHQLIIAFVGTVFTYTLYVYTRKHVLLKYFFNILNFLVFYQN